MTGNESVEFHFDLWSEPWIGVEIARGQIEKVGIGQALQQAHEYRGLFDSSPLVVVGIHRLLTAILQDIFSPQTFKELLGLLSLKQLPGEKVAFFHIQYGDRFDLFSPDRPFYQSVDVPPVQEKGANIKSIANLMPDTPSGTESTHYHHGSQAAQIFCPSCVAAGLVSLPAFSSSGGAGIKPSINGVPPIYVIPCGKNLLESLMLSLVLPDFQPANRAIGEDLAWWKREPVIPRSSVVNSVGYLHSLTFQPRRVRLYPEKVNSSCTRCGAPISWGVREMIFDMGESRPKDAAPWFDPFAAYKKSDPKPPIPIRPIEGKATWREYGSLFLKYQQAEDVNGRGNKIDLTIRPSFLDQLSELLDEDSEPVSLRCIGMRTDMKAKIFEWVDSGFQVPGKLLRDQDAGYWITKGLGFSRTCAATIGGVFKTSFGGYSKTNDRYRQLKSEMFSDYWHNLALPFREWVLQTSETNDWQADYADWMDRVTAIALTAFSNAASAVGDEGDQLSKRFKGEKLCQIYLAANRRKELPNE